LAKKILVVCSSGMSTSMLVKSMQKAADSENYPVKVESAGVAGIEDKISEAEAVLVGPQIKHRFDSLEDISRTAGKPIKLIPRQIYGLMDGKAALDLVKKMIEV